METRRPQDDEHARRWRRSPFSPAGFARPRGDGGDGNGTRDPRDPKPHSGGEHAEPDRPPSSG